MKVKGAKESNPMSMCSYLGHFKQARYLKQGHNDDGPGLASNLYQNGIRVDYPSDPGVPQDSLVDQLLNNKDQIAPDPVTPSVRDPGPNRTLPPPLAAPLANGHLRLSDLIGQATAGLGGIARRI